MSSNKSRAIQSMQDPTPVGPYSHAVLTMNDQLLFVSGKIPIDPVTGQMITDIKPATIQVMEYIRAILAKADMDFGNIVKAIIYLLDMGNFAQVNEIYASYFSNNSVLPARETVAVVALPKGAIIEISVIAVR